MEIENSNEINEFLVIHQNFPTKTYHILLGIVHRKKLREFCKSVSIHGCFLALLSWPECLYMRLPELQKLSCELYMTTKVANLQNFSSADDS